MQSERLESHLLKTLVSGAKPFHYRRGVRTLLGLPENPDTRVAYCLAPSMPGFNYLRQPSFGEIEIETSRAFTETMSPQTHINELPETEQFLERNEPPAIETRESTDIQADKPSLPRSLTPKPSLRPFAGTIEPIRADREAVPQKAAPATTEELRIDIPGISETPARFPALETRKTEKTPGSETPRPVSPAPESKEQQPRSDPGKAAAVTNKTGKSEAPGSLPRMSSRGSAVFRYVDPVSPHRNLESRSPKQDVPAGAEIAESAEPYRRTLPLASGKQAPRGQAVPIAPRPQRAAEIQLEQLRQKLSVLKRSAASSFQEPRITSQVGATRSNRPEDPVPQPVVVVNRSYPQRPSSPSAFWERSYLSHFLRLRRLR